jgi:hypothetical protein
VEEAKINAFVFVQQLSITRAGFLVFAYQVVGLSTFILRNFTIYDFCLV